MPLGIVGAILGDFSGRAIFGSDIGSFFDLSTWLPAILGSVAVLAVHHLATSRGHRAHG
ncbi:GlsB/YeaQ/YmgE family stress response membrane protein [Saccharothrix sp. Mg75]|uniref:GlsB/YeaQ/YmgE family stress response membrane protein n=1 Tax=Saccharothrix sp. Mg75 TaxID=3445357 RepID=UPI003EE9ED4B